MTRCARGLICTEPYIYRVILFQTLRTNQNLHLCGTAFDLHWPVHLLLRSLHGDGGILKLSVQCRNAATLNSLLPQQWLHVCHIGDDLLLSCSSLSCLFKQADMIQAFIHIFQPSTERVTTYMYKACIVDLEHKNWWITNRRTEMLFRNKRKHLPIYGIPGMPYHTHWVWVY